MNKELDLHKKLSDATVEYQRKFDAVREFEKTRGQGFAYSPSSLAEYARLQKEEKQAMEARDKARDAWMQYKKSNP